jgi:hypothetical protein
MAPQLCQRGGGEAVVYPAMGNVELNPLLGLHMSALAAVKAAPPHSIHGKQLVPPAGMPALKTATVLSAFVFDTFLGGVPPRCRRQQMDQWTGGLVKPFAYIYVLVFNFALNTQKTNIWFCPGPGGPRAAGTVKPSEQPPLYKKSRLRQ